MRVGALGLLSQPWVIVAQLVVASAWEAPYDYDLTRNTISDLGAVGCGTLQAAGGPVEVCSPWHVGMNASFVVIGSLLALGALLLAPRVAREPTPVVRVVALLGVGSLVVVGVSSAAVGLVPLDVDTDLHALVATPLFVAQPVALLLLGGLLLTRRGRSARSWGGVVVALGLVATAGTLAFAASLATGDVGGLYERVALWPGNIGVAVVGWTLLRRGSTGGGHGHGSVWEDAA